MVNILQELSLKTLSLPLKANVPDFRGHLNVKHILPKSKNAKNVPRHIPPISPRIIQKPGIKSGPTLEYAPCKVRSNYDLKFCKNKELNSCTK